MKQSPIHQKLDCIEKALTAKGHPMQDYSTIKMAMLDLLDVVKTLSDHLTCYKKPAKKNICRK